MTYVAHMRGGVLLCTAVHCLPLLVCCLTHSPLRVPPSYGMTCRCTASLERLCSDGPGSVLVLVVQDDRSVRVMLLQCSSSDWSGRVKGLAAIADAITDGRRRADVVGAADALGRAIMERVDDRNHRVRLTQRRVTSRVWACATHAPFAGTRCTAVAHGGSVRLSLRRRRRSCVLQVVQAALEAIAAIVRTYPIQFQAGVEAMLPRLCAHFGSATATNATKAREITALMRVAYDVNELVQWCIRVLLNTPEVWLAPAVVCVPIAVAAVAMDGCDDTLAIFLAFVPTAAVTMMTTTMTTLP